MIEVLKIEVIKSKIEAMPKEERALFMLLGHATNQINLLYKLLVLLTNKTSTDEPERSLSGAQAQILGRILIGILAETWELIRIQFLKNPMAKEYIPKLDDNGKDALSNLKKSFGQSDLLHKLRNKHILHYPSAEIMERAFQAVRKNMQWDKHWNWFFSKSPFNAFFFINDVIFMHGMLSTTPEEDLMLAYQKINDEVLHVSKNMTTFLMALMATFWKQHIGSDMNAQVIHIDGSPNFSDIWVPFFFEISPDEFKD